MRLMLNSTLKIFLISLTIFLNYTACSESSSEDEVKTIKICGEEVTNWENSPYVLPFPVGTEYYVNQANCSGFGHSDFWKFGYDFTMDIGTIVTASRDGIIGWATDGCPDGDRTCTNLVTIIHDDSTVSLYSHLTPGLLVEAGDLVKAGDTIGRSGDTGYTGGLPHLHFSIHPCNELPGLPNARNCPTLPANFRNTTPNPNGLLGGRFYRANPY